MTPHRCYSVVPFTAPGTGMHAISFVVSANSDRVLQLADSGRMLIGDALPMRRTALRECVMFRFVVSDL